MFPCAIQSISIFLLSLAHAHPRKARSVAPQAKRSFSLELRVVRIGLLLRHGSSSTLDRPHGDPRAQQVQCSVKIKEQRGRVEKEEAKSTKDEREICARDANGNDSIETAGNSRSFRGTATSYAHSFLDYLLNITRRFVIPTNLSCERDRDTETDTKFEQLREHLTRAKRLLRTSRSCSHNPFLIKREITFE